MEVACKEGFRGRGGGHQAHMCFSSFKIECWDGEFRDSGQNTSNGSLTARCVPSTCPAFNSAGISNSSNASNSSNTSALHDVNALSWNITSAVGYSVTINVTCKRGHRAVPRGYSAPVSCAQPSWYLASCGTCDWSVSDSCQPVWCPAPGGLSVMSSSPADFAIYGQENMTVQCSDGFMPVAPVTPPTLRATAQLPSPMPTCSQI